MTNATITVKGYLGHDKQVTREEFIDTWTYQVKDLWAICDTSEEFELAKQIKQQVAELAAKDFDRTLAKQEAA